MKFTTRIACAAMASALLAGPALADQAETVDYAAQVAELGGDAAKGEKVFNRCKACHDLAEKKNKVGPYLVGVIGRHAASVEGFKYSKAMTEAAADNPNTDEAGDGIVWSAETLTGFLTKPKKYLKGTRMAFNGLRKEDDIKNVLAFLAANGGLAEGTN